MSSTALNEMDSTTSTVFPLFLLRFPSAIDMIRWLESMPRLCVFAVPCASWYFNASTGEIFPAILPGLPQLMRTVIHVNSPDSTHTQTGGTINADSPMIIFVITSGSSMFPNSQPSSSPAGIPTADSTVPCRITM